LAREEHRSIAIRANGGEFVDAAVLNADFKVQ